MEVVDLVDNKPNIPAVQAEWDCLCMERVVIALVYKEKSRSIRFEIDFQNIKYVNFNGKMLLRLEFKLKKTIKF